MKTSLFKVIRGRVSALDVVERQRHQAETRGLQRERRAGGPGAEEADAKQQRDHVARTARQNRIQSPTL